MRKYITKASERIGVESTSRDGKRAQVVSYSTCENFIIRFCDGKEMKLKNWRYFIEGNFNYEKHFKASRNAPWFEDFQRRNYKKSKSEQI